MNKLAEYFLNLEIDRNLISKEDKSELFELVKIIAKRLKNDDKLILLNSD